LCPDPDQSHARPHSPHPPDRPAATLTHLITHTSGLPRLPAGFYRQSLPHWSTNPYAGYPAHRVVSAFLRARPGPSPGRRWRYSSFGVAVLGHALAAATQTPWEDLLTSQVLRPLGLTGTTLSPDSPPETGGTGTGNGTGPETGVDAIGHRADGTTPTPPLRIGGFQAAGGLRATPHDLLTFLEAHVDPEGSAAPVGSALADALRSVRRPVLRRGLDHRHVHTLTWFEHPAEDGGTFCFHCGATMGQQALLGFRPETGTALAAVATRRISRRDGFVPTAYALLSEV
jgi:CubicO group peptidase (beta-lactamase class C family)